MAIRARKFEGHTATGGAAGGQAGRAHALHDERQ